MGVEPIIRYILRFEPRSSPQQRSDTLPPLTSWGVTLWILYYPSTFNTFKELWVD